MTGMEIEAQKILVPLHEYLQHRQSACFGGCVCGLTAAVDEIEARLAATRHECDDARAALAAERERHAPLREAIESAGTDLIGFEGYFERLGSMGTVASIRRTLDMIDTALGLPLIAAPAPTEPAPDEGARGGEYQLKPRFRYLEPGEAPPSAPPARGTRDE